MHHVYVQEGTHHEMDYEFLPKSLPLSDLFFVFVFVVEPYTWGLPPTRFLSHHIISVSIQNEEHGTLPEAWPYFLNSVAETPVLRLWCCTHTVQRTWVALGHCQAKQQQ